MFEKEWFPKAHAMGVSWNEFWLLNPRIIRCIADGYSEKIKEQDYLNWVSNQYTLSAIFVALDRVLSGKKSKAKYIEEPILWKLQEELQLTEEERERREMEKEILAMEQWIANDRARGLPETNIE